jgi:hypothetical protein
MDAERETVVCDSQPIVQRSPRTHVDSQPLPTDSMVTVPLSETDGANAADENYVSPTTQHPEIVVEQRLSSRPNSVEIMKAFGGRGSQHEDPTAADLSPTISPHEEEVPESPVTPTLRERSRSDSSGSNQSAHVNWAELDKKEEQEPEGKGQDDVRFYRHVLVAVPNVYRLWLCYSLDWSRKIMLCLLTPSLA